MPFEADAVQQCLRRLPPRLRAALVLRFGDGLTESHVAAVLGCRTVTAHMLVARGLRRVRAQLARDERVATRTHTAAAEATVRNLLR